MAIAMTPTQALVAIPLLLSAAQAGRSQDEDRVAAWRELAKNSHVVVTARVIEPERSVERPERRIPRVEHLPGGGFTAEILLPDAYCLGYVWTLRVEAVHKPDGRAVVDSVIRVFEGFDELEDRPHPGPQEIYMLFLRHDMPHHAGVSAFVEPEPFRGTTLVLRSGQATEQEVPFDPTGVYSYTWSSEDAPRGTGSRVRLDQRTRAEIGEILTGVQQNLDHTWPNAPLLRDPRR